MAEALSIQVQKRDPAKNKGTGSRVARKLREQGRVPAILYGHKQAPLPISVHRDDVDLMLKKQAHIVELRHEDGTELAAIREPQWDHLGKQIIHLDFLRVDADEAVVSDVLVELAGESPAVGQGGMVEQILHHLKVRARPQAIPRVLKVDVGALGLGQSLHVRDLTLPEGVSALESEADLLVVHAVERKAAAEPAADGGDSAKAADAKDK